MKYKSNEPCCVSGNAEAEYHHIKTRGAGGTDDTFNMMPLTHPLHQECHQIGLSRFVEKYSRARLWLIKHGWSFDPVLLKWRRL